MIKTQDYLREFVTILFMRKKVVTAIFLLFIAGALLIAFFWPPVFASSGSIILKRNEAMTSPQSLEDVQAELTRITEDDRYSELEMLTSNTIVKRTAQRLGEESDFFRDRFDSGKGQRRLQNTIKTNLTAELVPQSNVIRLAFQWNEPAQAKEVLDIYLQEYLDYRSELYNPKEALSFFRQQIQKFNEQIGQRENKLLQLAQQHNLSDPTEQIKSNLLVVKNLEGTLADKKNEFKEKEAYINHIEEALKSKDYNFFTSIDNLEIGDYGQTLLGMIQEKRELLQEYTEESGKVQRMQEQIDSTHKSFREEVKQYLAGQKSNLQGIKENIERMESKINNLEQRNLELYSNMLQKDSIQREIDLLDTSYTTFGKRLEQANIKSKARTDALFNVGLLSEPATPTAPVFPQKSRVIGLGALIGLVMGITSGFLLEFFDHTFKRPEDVYNYTDMPHLCSLPRW
ncbi:MAG: GumC family protein [Lentisphaeria bacterium]